MMANTMKTAVLTLAAGANGSVNLDPEVKGIYLVPSAASAVHIIITNQGSSINASTNSLLVPSSGLVFRDIGRGLDRISGYNNSGSQVTLYIGYLI